VENLPFALLNNDNRLPDAQHVQTEIEKLSFRTIGTGVAFLVILAPPNCPDSGFTYGL